VSFKKGMLIAILALSALLILTGFLILRLPAFGAAPSGARLERVRQSPQFRDGRFVNAVPTTVMAKNASGLSMLAYWLKSHPRTEPSVVLPAVKNRLEKGPSGAAQLTWFGHSSYLIQTDDKTFLVDPVFGPRASFVSLLGPKPYPAKETWKAADLPAVDYVVLTHDHFDHLDYWTIREVKDRVGRFIVPLGVGAHLEHWGIPPSKLIELDWWERADLGGGLAVVAAPARHFSGRTLERGKTLWASFALLAPRRRFYFGGDSGYGPHFKEIGQRLGPFDLAMLECGQYDTHWPSIHLMPEENARAGVDLGAKWILPVHWGKYTLGTHAWDDGVERLTRAASRLGQRVTTPLIGERVDLDKPMPTRSWWRGLEDGAGKGPIATPAPVDAP
jgi:L-ascorbate metabolism protein UlaG (beta-lactamase superfamily)